MNAWKRVHGNVGQLGPADDGGQAMRPQSKMWASHVERVELQAPAQKVNVFKITHMTLQIPRIFLYSWVICLSTQNGSVGRESPS